MSLLLRSVGGAGAGAGAAVGAAVGAAAGDGFAALMACAVRLDATRVRGGRGIIKEFCAPVVLFRDERSKLKLNDVIN